MPKSKSKKNKSKKIRPLELSLRPYPGRLLVALTKESYEETHQRVFGISDTLTDAQAGRFSIVEVPGAEWTFLIWASNPHTLAHELSHVVLDVFDRCGIDPREGGGEPFCYMLSQLICEVNH